MATIYARKDSRTIWIRYKTASGRWKSKPTGYHWGNFGEERQARLLARKQSAVEIAYKPITNSEMFAEWVPQFIETHYGSGNAGTLRTYQRHWQNITRWLKEADITGPAQVEYKNAEQYLQWRLKEKAHQNTIIYELKFWGMVMNHAVRMGFITGNPISKLGFRKLPPAEKVPWKPEEFLTVEKTLLESDMEESQRHWMLTTLYMGLYQALRLRQSQIPLECIDFKKKIISYPAVNVKGGKPHSQPIDPRFEPILKKLVVAQKRRKEKTLCTVPVLGSLIWRQYLNKLGFKHLCHHGLRNTWITNAALNNVHQSKSMKYVNHGSYSVHRIYQRLSVDLLADVPLQVPLPSSLAAST